MSNGKINSTTDTFYVYLLTMLWIILFMSKILKFLLYLSAFIPLYVLLLLKIVIQIINNNLSVNVLNTILISLLCTLTGLGILGIFLAFNQGEQTQIYVVSATNLTEKHFLGYFSLFVLFALSYEIELICMAVIFVIILLFIGLVYLRNNLFYINPLLNIIGFSFYSIDYKQNGSEQTETTTVLYFGKLLPNTTYTATLTRCNFNIVQKK